ncbi:MAG: sulfatase [Opitutales bacterium]|nr:sulfatase [Opitutales bacterium]
MKKSLLIVTILAGLTLSVSAKEQPNILFLFADDWGRYAGVYRDYDQAGISDVIATPTIDRLARDGVMFTNAFFPVPSCTPCRGAIMTGQYFWRNGRAAFLGGGDWGPTPGLWEAIPKFPNILEYLGYHVGYAGKIGVDWWEAHHKTMQPHQHYTKNGRKFMNFSQNVSGKPDIEAAKQEIYDEVLANFRDFLGAVKTEDQPWFFWFGPYNVHRSWIKGSGKELWGIDPDDLEGKMPADWPDVHEVREDLADYLGEIMAFDAMCKVLLDELKRLGIENNTLVVATGDNGIPGFPRAKRNMYDKGIAAPLIARWPSDVHGRRVITDFVNIFDLAPTFIEAAGGTPPESMDARSLMPQLTNGHSGRIDPNRDHIITGRERHVVPYPMRAIRTEEYLYVRNYQLENRPKLPDEPPEELPSDLTRQMDGGPTKEYLFENWRDPDVWALVKLAFDRRAPEELYDLRKDPDQLVNLADAPTYADVKADLSDRLFEVMKAGEDDRIHPGESKYDRPPYIEADPEKRGKW